MNGNGESIKLKPQKTEKKRVLFGDIRDHA